MAAHYSEFVKWCNSMGIKEKDRGDMWLSWEASAKLENEKFTAYNRPIMPVCPHYSREMVKTTEYIEMELCTCKGTPGKPA